MPVRKVKGGYQWGRAERFTKIVPMPKNRDVPLEPEAIKEKVSHGQEKEEGYKVDTEG